MQFIHKKTFQIYRNVLNYDAADSPNFNDYFKVDDLIALPIQILNRKGYTTVSCCAGHPFTRNTQMTTIDGSKIEVESGRSWLCCDSHIGFLKGISLPELPPGFVTDDFAFKEGLVIRRYYDKFMTDDNNCPLRDIDVYGYMTENLEAMKQLYLWALDLPDFKE